MKRLSNAMGPAGLVIGALALVLAMCGGTAVAASMITTSQIKNGAVTNAKLAGNAVTGGKVANGSLSLSDLKASDRAKVINTGISTTTVESPDVTVAAGDIGSVTATCPTGKKVTGGGFFGSISQPAMSAPSGTTGWYVLVNNNTSISVTINAYAVCA